MRLRKRITNEEKVAMKIDEMLSDNRLDIEEVGRYISEISHLNFNRFILMADSAEERKKGLVDERYQYKFF